MVRSGLDILAAQNFYPLRGKKVGILCHQASVTGNLEHIVDLLVEAGIVPYVIFAPEHGLYPVAQDQVGIGDWRHPEYDIPIYSLYGADFESLNPPEEIMRQLDVLVVDLFDVGARYYTFVWTAVLAMKVSARLGIKILLLDRPNPIRGDMVEGPPQENEFLSFVGLYPIPVRHGMTIGEILNYVNQHYNIGAELEIVPMTGWRRNMWFDETGLPWVMPSPNMPAPETALVYPGMCLLEGTNVSEGRGTTRPFEIFGAPFINPYRLKEMLEFFELEGVTFRITYFTPTFNKFAGQVCGGIQLHVVDRDRFVSLKTGLAVIVALVRLYKDEFEFKSPPYEFEREKLPIDILLGSDKWRNMILDGAPLIEIWEEMEYQRQVMQELIRPYLLY